jgi:hypothetical protein
VHWEGAATPPPPPFPRPCSHPRPRPRPRPCSRPRPRPRPCPRPCPCSRPFSCPRPRPRPVLALALALTRLIGPPPSALRPQPSALCPPPCLPPASTNSALTLLTPSFNAGPAMLLSRDVVQYLAAHLLTRGALRNTHELALAAPFIDVQVPRVRVRVRSSTCRFLGSGLGLGFVHRRAGGQFPPAGAPPSPCPDPCPPPLPRSPCAFWPPRRRCSRPSSPPCWW